MSILITPGLSARAAAALFGLFTVQFLGSVLLAPEVDRLLIIGLSVLCLVLAAAQFVRHRSELFRTTRDGLRTPFAELEEADEVAATTAR